MFNVVMTPTSITKGQNIMVNVAVFSYSFTVEIYTVFLLSTISYCCLLANIYQHVTQAFARALGIQPDIVKEKFSPCISNEGCCNDPNAVMAPLGNLKINRTIKSWSPCSLNNLITYINKNGGAEFCLFRMKKSKSCSCKFYN